MQSQRHAACAQRHATSADLEAIVNEQPPRTFLRARRVASHAERAPIRAAVLARCARCERPRVRRQLGGASTRSHVRVVLRVFVLLLVVSCCGASGVVVRAALLVVAMVAAIQRSKEKSSAANVSSRAKVRALLRSVASRSFSCELVAAAWRAAIIKSIVD